MLPSENVGEALSPADIDTIHTLLLRGNGGWIAAFHGCSFVILLVGSSYLLENTQLLPLQITTVLGEDAGGPFLQFVPAQPPQGLLSSFSSV